MNLALPSRPNGPHPDPEVLDRAFLGPRDAEALRALEHLALCAECSREMHHRESFGRADRISARELKRAWSRFTRGGHSYVRPLLARSNTFTTLAAAGAVAAVLTAVLLWLPPSPAGDRFRGQSASVTLVSPAGDLTAPPEEFVFARRSAQSAGPVRVTLFDASQTYVWTSEATRADRVALPSEQRERLRPGTEYFWTILTDEDAVPARSFRLRGPP